MWQLDTEWYELVLRALAVFSFLFIVMRLWGKKHFGEFTPFDFILLLIMSEAVQNALVENDKGVPAAFITIGTLVAMNIFLNKLTFYFRKAERIIDGTPEVLIKNGKINREMLNKQTITDQELHEALRMEGVLDVDEVFLAMMETNGKISVIKKKDEGFLKRMLQH